MRNLFAAHAPTYGYFYGVEEMMALCGKASFTALCEIFQDRENLFWWFKFRQLYPEMLWHIRIYPDNGRWVDGKQVWPGLNWVQLATEPGKIDVYVDEIYKRLTTVRRATNEDGTQWVVPGIEEQPFSCSLAAVSVMNECSLRVEGHPKGAFEERDANGNLIAIKINVEQEVYDLANNLQYEVMTRFDKKYPGRKFKWLVADDATGHEPPGMAPDYQYQLPSFKRVMNYADGAVVHGYGNENEWATVRHADERTRLNWLYWGPCRSVRPKGWRDAIDGVHPGGPDLGGVATQWPGKIMWMAEFGGKRHDIQDGGYVENLVDMWQASMDLLAPRLVGLNTFIWESDDVHKGARLYPNKPLLAAINAMDKKQAAPWGQPVIPPVVPPTGGETMPDQFEYILGFAEYAKAHPEIGKPISPLMYDANGTGVQYTETGMLHWVKASNRVLFFRAAGT
jgi:hypothetical protein